MNLKHLIESVNVLNVDDELSTIYGTEVIRNKDGNHNISNNKYILTDSDEELLILIKFKQIVSLRKIKIYASNNMRGVGILDR